MDHVLSYMFAALLITQYLPNGVERTAHAFHEREKVKLVNLR